MVTTMSEAFYIANKLWRTKNMEQQQADKKRPRYSKAFKIDCFNAVQSGESVASVAKRFNIGESTIYKWVYAYKKRASYAPGKKFKRDSYKTHTTNIVPKPMKDAATKKDQKFLIEFLRKENAFLRGVIDQLI